MKIKNLFYGLALLGILYCSQEEKNINPPLANRMCDVFYAQGEIEYGIYYFCSIMPVAVEYTYKKDTWRFWNKRGRLIAEGIFDIEKQRIDGVGGCPFEMLEGKIDKVKWRFWDENGKEMEPTCEFIDLLESCEVH